MLIRLPRPFPIMPWLILSSILMALPAQAQPFAWYYAWHHKTVIEQKSEARAILEVPFIPLANMLDHDAVTRNMINAPTTMILDAAFEPSFRTIAPVALLPVGVAGTALGSSAIPLTFGIGGLGMAGIGYWSGAENLALDAAYGDDAADIYRRQVRLQDDTIVTGGLSFFALAGLKGSIRSSKPAPASWPGIIGNGAETTAGVVSDTKTGLLRVVNPNVDVFDFTKAQVGAFIDSGRHRTVNHLHGVTLNGEPVPMVIKTPHPYLSETAMGVIADNIMLGRELGIFPFSSKVSVWHGDGFWTGHVDFFRPRVGQRPSLAEALQLRDTLLHAASRDIQVRDLIPVNVAGPFIIDADLEISRFRQSAWHVNRDTYNSLMSEFQIYDAPAWPASP